MNFEERRQYKKGYFDPTEKPIVDFLNAYPALQDMEKSIKQMGSLIHIRSRTVHERTDDAYHFWYMIFKPWLISLVGDHSPYPDMRGAYAYDRLYDYMLYVLHSYSTTGLLELLKENPNFQDDIKGVE